MDKTVALYWIKKDIRLNDNTALMTALRQHSTVVPIFVLEASYLKSPETSVVHINATLEALNDLRNQFQEHNIEPLFLHGEVVPVFQKLFSLYPFGYIYSHEEVGNNRTYQRDKAAIKWCRTNGVILREFQHTGVVRRLKDRDTWTVKWRDFYSQKLEPVPSARQFQKMQTLSDWKSLDERFEPNTDDFIREEGAEELKLLQLQKVSETQALADLHDFMYRRGIAYRGGISSPNTALTAGSRLSVHLAFGTISGRYVYQKVNERITELRESGANDSGKWVGSLVSFKSRMHWRDHFMQRLESEPIMELKPLNRAYEELVYVNNPAQIEAFFAGKTGYPMIDAVVRCLHQTRFINFRMRSMITSFACHTLQIDWRLINKPLARLFLDYEPGIHLSQLQMQAGVVGINTLRTYNPTKQLIDQDPACIFVKKWVPELRNFTPAEIIDHVTFPLADYVRPIVEWKVASAEMRKKISDIRKSFFTKEISQAVFQKHGSRKKNMMGKREAKPKAVNPNAPSLFD
jgi:deoxyribodipyrimidine photo-lyase